MERLLHAMEHGGGAAEPERIPIIWSEARRDQLRRVAANQVQPGVPVDRELALPMLRCCDGRFLEAERAIIAVLRANLDACHGWIETYISLLYALFVVQRFDLVAELLRIRYGYGRELEITANREGPGLGRVLWEILPSGAHRFTFTAQAFENDSTRIEILAFQWAFPINAAYSHREDQETGSVWLNQHDVGRTPGLGWCDGRPDYFLIPDCIFTPSLGYQYAREVLRRNEIAWHERRPVALWRGGTTGIPASHSAWRSLERVRLCEIARRNEHTGLVDIGLSSIDQFGDPEVIAEIRASGLMRDPVPWADWGRWRYLIDIDGNSSPWSNLFQRLLTGSVVLKVESSRALRQWYYDELVPWRNFVPVAPDMSDLMEKISWLYRNDSAARRIGEAGLELANIMTYERELDRAMDVVTACFRYYNGKPEGVGPFGRGNVWPVMAVQSED